MVLNKDLHDKLFSLIRSGLDQDVSLPEYSKSDLENILKIAVRQSITPVIYRGIKRAGFSSDDLFIFEKAWNSILVRTILINDAYKKIIDTLENAGIDYVPLKGSVLKELYPDPLLRTSSDIDILVKEADLNSAVKALETNTDFVAQKRYYHDVSMLSPDVHLELHYRINENMENVDKLLSSVWDYAIKSSSHQHRFVPEFQVFYVMSHMYYHLLNGGLGIRPLLDLWLLRTKTQFSESQVCEMCSECGILTFYQSCCSLVDCWMEGKTVPDELILFEDYVLSGGVFGNKENNLASKQRKHRGFSYYFHRVFLSRNLLEIEYPILKTKPYLIPVFQIRRWFNLFNSEKRKSVRSEIENVNRMQSSTIEAYDDLLSSLGL